MGAIDSGDSNKTENEYRDITFNGLPEAWKELFESSHILMLGTVLAFFGNGTRLDNTVAGWHLFISHLIDKDNRVIFKNVQHIAPRKIGGRYVRKNIQELLRKQGVDIGWDVHEAENFADLLHVSELESSDGATLIQEINNVADEAAVAVSCTQLYRFDDIEEEELGSVTTWSGLQYRSVTTEQRYYPHIIRMMREILHLAKKKRLFLTLFFEEYGPGIADLPEDLQNDSDLIVVATPVPQDLRTIPKLLQKLRIDGIDAALSETNKLIGDPQRRVLITSQLLLGNGDFASAWEVLRPHIGGLSGLTATLSLTIAQAAFAAGMFPESQTFLNKALEKGVESIEDLNSAQQLAGKLRLEGVGETVVGRMKTEYSNHRITLSVLYDSAYAKRDFVSARRIAEQLGDSFDVQLCNVFCKDELDLDTVFKYAKEIGRIDKAYFDTASEAEHRNDFLLARELASKVPANSLFISGATRVRVRILGNTLLSSGNLKDEEIEELRQVLSYIATHPADLDVRFAVEELLEGELEEPASKVMLLTILLNLMSLCFQNNASTSVVNEVETVDVSVPDQEEMSFFEDFLDSLSGNVNVLGYGKLPPNIEDRASAGLLRSFLLLVQHAGKLAKDESDINYLKLLLHAVVLITKKLNDPNSDLIAVRSAIAVMANVGFLQAARDLAETCLLTIPTKQPDQLMWRLSQMWASYSDACHRAGNVMAALRYLTLSFLSYTGIAPNYVLLASSYRIATRIFRDLGLTEFALETLDAERKIRIRLGSDRYYLHQIDAVEVSIRASNLSWDTPLDKLMDLFTKADELIREDQSEEVAPLLTFQASVYRIIKIMAAELPHELKERFANGIKNLNTWQKSVVDAVLTITPTKQDIIDAASKTPEALNWNDLSYQVRHLSILAHNSLPSAVEGRDIVLFIMASAFLSQPILSLKTIDVDDQASLSDNLRVQKWWFNLLTEENPSRNILESHKIFQTVSTASLKSVVAMTDTSLEQVVGVLGENEAMMVFCMNDRGIMYSATIYRNGEFEMERIEPSVWTPERFLLWRRFYPRGYGRWQPRANLWDREQPSKSEVRESIKNLSACSSVLQQELIIVPDARIFGFPFKLMPEDDGFLGEDVQISIAPSISWLVAARSKEWAGEFERKAWLGSPASGDYPIHLLRNRLGPALAAHKVEVIENASPIGLTRKALVIVGSHGAAGLADHFKNVSDGVAVYSGKEFATYFEGCGCVVLFICNAGRSDKQTRSSETMGLVADLLRNGVRCVIAPSWSLHLEVAGLWLPPFLSNIASGETIGRSAHNAAREVNKTYDNPCAWAALQLFGDATWKPRDN
jgi:hypothetical protein